MREIDKLFITLFKNIRIVENEQGGYSAFTNTKPKNSVTNKEIVGLVKQYQDLLLEEILNTEVK